MAMLRELTAAARVIQRESARLDATAACVVLATDGRSVADDLETGVLALARSRSQAVGVDTEAGFVRLGRARALAQRLGAEFVCLAA